MALHEFDVEPAGAVDWSLEFEPYRPDVAYQRYALISGIEAYSTPSEGYWTVASGAEPKMYADIDPTDPLDVRVTVAVHRRVDSEWQGWNILLDGETFHVDAGDRLWVDCRRWVAKVGVREM